MENCGRLDCPWVPGINHCWREGRVRGNRAQRWRSRRTDRYAILGSGKQSSIIEAFEDRMPSLYACVTVPMWTDDVARHMRVKEISQLEIISRFSPLRIA